MSLSNSFEDVLKQVLVTEKKKVKPSPKIQRKKRKESFVSEALNSNTMPNTMTPAGYSGGPRGMPPFSKYTTDATPGSIDMRDIGKEDEEFAKSEQRKPYPLENILDFIISSGASLKNAETLINAALKSNISMDDKNKKMLKDALQVLKSSYGNISKAARVIDSITLS